MIKSNMDEDIDIDLCPDRSGPGWEEIMRDVDVVFQSLEAGAVVRQIVALRLQDCTIDEIAERLGLPEYTVRRRLAIAGDLLVDCGIVDRPWPRQGHDSLHRNALAHPLPSARRKSARSTRTGSGELESRETYPVVTRPSLQGPAIGDKDYSSPSPGSHSHSRLQPCPRCEARLRPLTPAQSFGWRQVYYSEVHRYSKR